MKVQIGGEAFAVSDGTCMADLRAWLEALPDGRLEPSDEVVRQSGICGMDHLRNKLASLPDMRPYRCKVRGRTAGREFRGTLCWGNPRTVACAIANLGAKP